MSSPGRLSYYRRIFSAYLGGRHSHLSFWHDAPQENPNASAEQLGQYYMVFSEKAGYSAHCDETGIPLLDYHGRIGLQYNPIAIAQWGLGNYNLFCGSRQTGGALDENRKRKFLAASDWLCAHLEPNSFSVPVWNHHFDWEYRTPLKAPWYSGLAQGQGISLLVRAHKETGIAAYLDAARRAFAAFHQPVSAGGVAFTGSDGNLWFEEYIVSPPTHILNGFIWAAWGVWDYFLATGNATARDLFTRAVETLRAHLESYDLGFWSLYEQSGTRLPMVASAFYHRLHIVQLRIMHSLTGKEEFARYAERWQRYAQNPLKRSRALGYKIAFKLCYY